MLKKFAFIQPFIADGNLTPPIGTLIMASLIRQKGWEVAFFDERLSKDALNELLDFKPHIVGISAVTASVLRAKELASNIKKCHPQTLIVFGGPHPSAMPHEVVSWDCVDFVVVGEGEDAITKLIDWYEGSRQAHKLHLVPNLFFKQDNQIIQTHKSAFLTPSQLDSLPQPAFDLLPLEDIFKKVTHGLFAKGKRILPIMCSRGCPNHCTYCCRVMGFQIRYKSTETVISEIQTLCEKYNIDEIWIEDDNFTANKVRCIKILDEIISRKLNLYIKFANGVRADGVDEQLLDKMLLAGCYSISFGIETGSERVLKMMKKNLSLTKAKANVQLAKSKGLLVGANCIIGYPEETPDDIKVSLDYFFELGLDSMAIVNLIPFPATEVRELCVQKGYLTKEAENWNNYIFDIASPRVLIETPYLNKQQVIDFINYAYKRMYLNPTRMLKLIKHSNSKVVLNGLKVMMKKLIS